MLSRRCASRLGQAFQSPSFVRSTFALILSLAIILLTSPAEAATIASAESIDLQVDLGFHGYYAPGYRTPVRIRLINHGGVPISGELILSQTAQTLQGQTRTVRIVQAINLPAEAHQRYELELPIFSSREFLPSEAQLQLVLRDRDRTLAQQTISLGDYRDALGRLNLLLSEAPESATLPDGQALVSVDPQELPEHWVGYQGVQRLYLGRFNLDSLSSEQRQALQDWLSSGGELVVLLGGNWYFQQGRALEELLPFMPSDVQVVTINGSSQQVTVGQTRGTVLESAESGPPLLIQGRFGRGFVYAVTVNPFALGSGPQDQALWQRLSSAPDDEATAPNLGSQLLGSLQLEEPSRLILSGILLLNLGGVALLGLVALRTRRFLWGVVLWTGLISLGLLLYLRQPAFTHPLRAIEVGRIWVRGDRAFIQDWYSAFARSAVDLKLQMNSQALVDQAEVLHDLTVNQSADQQNLRLDLGAQERAHLRLDEPIHFPVEFSIRPASSSANIPEVMVYNETDQELLGAMLWWQGRYYSLGAVAAHGHLERTLDEPRDSPPEDRANGGEGLIEQHLLADAQGALATEPTLLAWVRDQRFAHLPDEYRTVTQLVSVAGR
jgi:hypothetical protein